MSRAGARASQTRSDEGGWARELIAVAYPDGAEPVSAGAATKQLIVLATDVLLAELARAQDDPEGVAQQLIDDRVLPACYASRYDRRFLAGFHNTVELARNLLVGDLPFAPTTAGELAVHAILGRARRILADRGAGPQTDVISVEPILSRLLASDATNLYDGLEWLESMVIEDADALYLFDVPPDEEPDRHLRLPGATSDIELLRFENWQFPFGNPPRPQITYDGRAWPA